MSLTLKHVTDVILQLCHGRRGILGRSCNLFYWNLTDCISHCYFFLGTSAWATFTLKAITLPHHLMKFSLHLHNDQFCSFLLRSFPLDHTRRRPSPNDHIRGSRFPLLNLLLTKNWRDFCQRLLMTMAMRQLGLRHWGSGCCAGFGHAEDYWLHWGSCRSRNISNRSLV